MPQSPLEGETWSLGTTTVALVKHVDDNQSLIYIDRQLFFILNLILFVSLMQCSAVGK